MLPHLPSILKDASGSSLIRASTAPSRVDGKPSAGKVFDLMGKKRKNLPSTLLMSALTVCARSREEERESKSTCVLQLYSLAQMECEQRVFLSKTKQTNNQRNKPKSKPPPKTKQNKPTTTTTETTQPQKTGKITFSCKITLSVRKIALSCVLPQQREGGGEREGERERVLSPVNH